MFYLFYGKLFISLSFRPVPNGTGAGVSWCAYVVVRQQPNLRSRRALPEGVKLTYGFRRNFVK